MAAISVYVIRNQDISLSQPTRLCLLVNKLLFTVDRYTFRVLYQSHRRAKHYKSVQANLYVTPFQFDCGSEISRLTTVYFYVLLFLV